MRGGEAFLVALLVAGCPDNNREAPEAGAPVTTSSGFTASRTAGRSDESSGATGIPECDEYLEGYACFMRKMYPGNTQNEATFKQMGDGYRQAALYPASKASAAEACRKTAANMHDNFVQAGCARPH